MRNRLVSIVFRVLLQVLLFFFFFSFVVGNLSMEQITLLSVDANDELGIRNAKRW